MVLYAAYFKIAKHILVFEMCNDDRMSTWKVKAVPPLPTEGLIVQLVVRM